MIDLHNFVSRNSPAAELFGVFLGEIRDHFKGHGASLREVASRNES